LNKAKARFIDPTKPAYDVLLDQYEKGMTQVRLDAIFSEVRAGLVPFIHAGKTFDVENQAKLCREIALDLGFDIQKGRLDVSVHPFTGGAGPTDVRMTTRFKADDITEGLTGAIHETGHALYEQGRNLSEEWEGLCVNEAMSMGVHESQSLLWERMVALQRYKILL
jgi:carboxypeptidase Taq